MDWPKFKFPKIRLPFRLPLPKIQIPTLKLPTFKLPSLVKPNFNISGLTIGGKLKAIGNVFASALSPFEKQLTKLTGNIASALSPNAISGFVTKTIQTGLDTITNTVENVVNGAIDGAVGAVSSIIGGVVGQATSIVNIINGVTNKVNAAFAKPRLDTTNFINSQIDSIIGQTVEKNTIGYISGAIKTNAKELTSRFSNKQLKDLAENPLAKQALITSTTIDVFNKTSKTVTENLKSQNYPAQVVATDSLSKLNTPVAVNYIYGIPDSRIIARTRLERINTLIGIKNDFAWVLIPQARKDAIEAEIIRLRNTKEIYPPLS